MSSIFSDTTEGRFVLHKVSNKQREDSGQNDVHAVLGMNTIMPCTGSCRVTPGKDRLLQHPCVSPVSTTRHDPEVWCDFRGGGEGSKHVSGSDKVSQNTSSQCIFIILLVLFR